MNGPYKIETPLGTGRSYVLNGEAHRIHTFDCTADAESFCEQMNEAYRTGAANSQKSSEWTAEFPTEEGCYWVLDYRNASDVNSGLYLIRIKGAGNKQWIEHMGTAAVTTHEDMEEYKKEGFAVYTYRLSSASEPVIKLRKMHSTMNCAAEGYRK